MLLDWLEAEGIVVREQSGEAAGSPDVIARAEAEAVMWEAIEGDAERAAEALVYVDLAHRALMHRSERHDRAADALAVALDEFVAARADMLAACDLVEDAARLYALARAPKRAA